MLAWYWWGIIALVFAIVVIRAIRGFIVAKALARWFGVDASYCDNRLMSRAKYDNWTSEELDRMSRPSSNLNPSLKVWRTVRIGNYKTKEDLKLAVRNAGGEVFSWIESVTDNPGFQLSCPEEDVDLFLVSNTDLGRPNGCDLGETLRLALDAGLELCPHETASQLFVQYRDQPKGDGLGVVLKPIHTPDPKAGITGSPLIVVVGHPSNAGTGRVLFGQFACAWAVASGPSVAIFCRRGRK